jgi:hypothetical protein
LLEHDNTLLYHLKPRKIKHDSLIEWWQQATNDVPCLGNPPDWLDLHEYMATMTWVGMEASVLMELKVELSLDGNDLDDSDLENLIKPELPMLVVSEVSRLIDGEDERLNNVDSDTDDIDIDL